MAKQVFIIAAPLADREAVSHTERVLGRIAGDLGANVHLPLSLEAAPDVHFASFVIFPDGKGGGTLVFENCVDGPLDAYLKGLADRPGIDGIFRHCTGYPGNPEASSRERYLRSHLWRPQLYHLGAPHRTVRSIVEDRQVRSDLDVEVARTSAPALLLAQTRHATSGIRHFGVFDVVKPRVALVIVMLLSWLLARIIAVVEVDPRPWWRAILLIDAALVGAGLLVAIGVWRRAAPEIRARARPFALLALLLGPGVAAAVIVRPALVQTLWDTHRALTMAALAMVLLLWLGGIGLAIRRRRREAIAEARKASGPGPSLVPFWTTLREIERASRATRRSAPGPAEHPGWLRRLGNWRWWFGLVLGAAGVAAVVEWMAPAFLIPVLIAAFTLKALWFAVLVGWPRAGASGAQWRSIVAFVALATAAGVLLVVPFGGAGDRAWALGILTAAGLMVLWVPRVPPPDGIVPAGLRPPAGLDEQEEQDVQNHMALMVEVTPRWRRVCLRAFLRTLNGLFFRCVLPDLQRATLFGLPTVHCAQWVLIDGGRYLFLSNYDHSWETYLDDFGAHLASGVQKIWGQSDGNPGVTDFALFKRFVRTRMVPYHVWYRAYPGLTVRQISNTERLLAALARDIPEEKVLEALRRLGAAPKVLPEFVHAD